MENSLDPDYAAKMAAAKDNLGQCETKVFHALTLLFNCLTVYILTSESIFSIHLSMD